MFVVNKTKKIQLGKQKQEKPMAFELPALPYDKEALQPHISKETLEFHHGKHHQTYVTKLNGMVKGTEHEEKSLEEIMKTTSGGMFNQAAQIWNHTFYWNSLSPQGGGEPSGKIKEQIEKSFGSFSEFKSQFDQAAAGAFGSAWVWLVKNGDKLEITTTFNAGCPLVDGVSPILTCDVWEHAYYIDYRNSRPNYLEAFWSLVNWDFAEKNLG